MDKNDHLVSLVWIAFIPLGILTLIFGPALVIFSESTRTFWSWEIQPAMSAVWVGAGYIFGACAITTMLVVGSWRSGLVAIIATWPFAIVMFVATMLHTDRFFLGTLNFYIWLAIYIILPVALPVIWWLNRGRDPGLQPGDFLIPKALSVGAGIAGIILILISLLMIVSPTTAAGYWPWSLTPLMSQVIGGWIMFLGTGLCCLFFERRYIAYRYFLPSAGFWMALLFVASFFHLDNFNFTRIGSWFWFVLTGLLSVIIFGLFFYLERSFRSLANPSAAVPAMLPGTTK